MKPIQILINAKDNASAVFTGLQAKVMAVGTVIASYFGIEAFKGVVQSAADLEAAMSRVQAATDGSAQEMAELKKAAEDAGASTKFTSVEAASALENLAKAGLDAKDAVAALPAVLNLAQAGDIELATASEYLTKAVMGMGLAFTDAGRVADVLAKGANATNTSVDGLAQALSYAAPVATSLGVSLESTVAIIGKFADAGIDASRAGTALNSIMSQFSDPASKFRRELASVGIVTTDFESALHQLAAAGPRGAQAIQSVGLEAGPALRALLNQGMPALDELTQKLRDAEGSAAATAATMQNNLQGSLLGLRSIWDAVMQTLGTPVLPAVRQAVDQLTASLRTAVADGTVAKFGEALATAFTNGWQAVQKFVAGLDVQAIITQLQEMADSVGESMAKVSEHATNASNAVQMAWSVMAGGVNAIMAVIYKVGEAFAGVASNIQSGLALLYEGLSKITFGELSAAYAQAAKEVEESARATWAASEALAKKSEQAFLDMAEHAQKAREGYFALTAEAVKAVPVIAKMADAVGEVTQKIQKQIEEQQKAKKAAEDKRKADQEAAETIKHLKAEYESLLQSGSIQAAAEKFQELQRAMQGVRDVSGGMGKEAGAATKQVLEAFQQLGITSSAELKQQAENARVAYDTIRESGTASARDIEAAFRIAAEKAIAANDGVAPAWVRAQSAAAGFRVEVDAAGKATLKAAEDARKGTKDLADGFDRAAKSVRDYKKEVTSMPPAPGGKGGGAPAPGGRGGGGGGVGGGKAPARSPREINQQDIDRDTVMKPVDLVPMFESLIEAEEWWKAYEKDYWSRNNTNQVGLGGGWGMDIARFEFDAQVAQLKRDLEMQEAVARRQASQAQAAQVNGQGLRNQDLAQRRIVDLRLNGQSLGEVHTDSEGEASLGRLISELERGKRGF